jgi:hypothetical protein
VATGWKMYSGIVHREAIASTQESTKKSRGKAAVNMLEPEPEVSDSALDHEWRSCSIKRKSSAHEIIAKANIHTHRRIYGHITKPDGLECKDPACHSSQCYKHSISGDPRGAEDPGSLRRQPYIPERERE